MARACVTIAVCLLQAACFFRPTLDGDGSTGDSPSTTTDAPTSTSGTTTSTTEAATSMLSVTVPTLPDTSSTDPTLTSAESGTDPDPSLPDPSSTSTSEPLDCPDPIDQPQDAECTDQSGCGCASGKCFLVPILGGWCGECLVDSDCPGGGCTVPNPVGNDGGVGSTCNSGQAGDGCMTDGVCNDPLNPSCATLFEVPGIITVATCGECSQNADCPASAPNCTPVYDVLHFTGVTTCVPDSTVQDDSGCNLTPDDLDNPVGNNACASGFCGEANVMGLLKVGICGQCNADSDCPNNQACTDPVVDLDLGTLVGSVCQ